MIRSIAKPSQASRSGLRRSVAALAGVSAAMVLALSTLGLSTQAVRADEASDPTVKARMEGMKQIRAHSGVLGDMAKGKLEFSETAAAEAAAALGAEAQRIPALFAEPATDPESEAKPAIWDNMADFESNADALYQAAMAVDTSSLDGVRAGMRDIGVTCKACHDDYKD